MKTTDSISKEIMIDKGLNLLHEESKDWLSEIKLWKSHIGIINKHVILEKIPREVELQIDKTNEALRILDALLDRIYSDTDQHRHRLFVLLNEERPDEEAYREEHKKIRERINAAKEHFYDLEREMSKMYEAAHIPLADLPG